MKTRMRRRGKVKAGLIVVLVSVLAVGVPIGLYFLSQFVFPNGSTGEDLSVPNTASSNSLSEGNSPAAAAVVTGSQARSPVNASPAGERMMDLLVIDHDTRQPVAGIRIQTQGNGRMRTFNGRTGPDGHVKFPIPSEKNPSYFNVRVTGQRYLDKRLQWVPYQPELSGEVFDKYTMEMERTTKISGKIVDDAGRPVAGASVELEFDKKYSSPHEQVAYSAYNQRNPIKSGPDGSWSFSGAPLNCDSIGLVAWDHEHVSDDFWSPQPFGSVSQLYDGTAVYVLHNGLTLDGVVTGPDGAPLARVSVARGQQVQSVNSIPAVTTDGEGKFKYVYAAGQQVILTFSKPGYGPEMKQMTMGGQNQTLNVSLSKGHRIFGKVVDASGRGVRNARFYLRSWRGFQTINANFQTDSAGNFHWNNAPADTVTFEINAPGLREINEQPLEPDKENDITLGVGSRVHGVVTDAGTGQPIDKFDIDFGIVWQEGQDPVWQDRGWADGVVLSPGKFSFKNEYPFPGIALKVEASGYWPAVSRIIKPSESGDINIELKLKPGHDLIGTVRGLDGNPVAGALVVMAQLGQGNQVFIDNFKEVRSQAVQQITGADGRVDFPPGSEAFKLVAMADAGYAEVDQSEFARSSDIKLKPWGRIEGRLKVGSKPGAWLTLDIVQTQRDFDQNEPEIFNQIHATTDASGGFVFARVPAGIWRISRRIPRNKGWQNQPLDDVEVAEGKTATINLGGNGRPIVGKVVIPPELLARTDWSYGFCSVQTRMNRNFESVPMPDDIKNGTTQQMRAWMMAWSKTDAGKAFNARQRAMYGKQRLYPLSPAADATFRIEDVPPGNYDVTINLRSNITDPTRPGMPDEVGTGYEQIAMPPIPVGGTDNPLQIDPISVMKVGKYNAGDVVYDLEMKLSDGGKAKLSDFHGKYLVLDLRSGADQSIAALKSVYEEYGRSSHFAMLTILTRFNPFGSNTGLAGIPWPQAVNVSGRTDDDVLDWDFDIARQPQSVWLIGPDGKIIQADLAAGAVESAVSAVLGAPSTRPATMP